MTRLLDLVRYRARLLRLALTMQPVAGGDGTEEPPADPPQDPPADPPKNDEPQGRSFSQADVDRIVEERLKRAEPKQAELREKAAKYDEMQAANQTELEKAQAAAAKAAEESQQAIERANKTLVRAAVLAEATKQNAVKPEHLHKLIDTDGVTVGDDGQVTGVEEAVTDFLEANPEYVGGKRRTNGDADQGARGSGPNQLASEDLASMSPDEIVKARREGRLDGVLGA